jgi:hypothetical protein
MKVEDFKKGCGFIVQGISFVRLCSCIAAHPGVSFTDRRRFFLGADDIRGEFMFRGHAFKIEPWDIDDSIFVSPKDKEAICSEIVEIRDHVAQFCLQRPGFIKRLKSIFT